jgi:hypothetical protein
MLHLCDRWLSGRFPSAQCQNKPVHGYWLEDGPDHLAIGPTIYLCDEHAEEYPKLVEEGQTSGKITGMTFEEEVTSDVMDS